MNDLNKTGNPALRTKAFSQTGVITGDRMTVYGTIGKSVILLVLLTLAAGWVWGQFYATASMAAVSPYMIGGVIGGLVFALATSFKPNWSPITAPLYAICEGLALGGFSAIFELRYPGIVIQAVGLTLAVAFGMLTLYRTGIVKVTDRFKRMLIAATAGIMLFYLVTWVVSMFGVDTSLIYGHSSLSIGISLVIVAIAAFNLVLDFDIIAQQSAMGAPRFMEWYGAFALMVTLVWLYLEILRLLGNTRR
ncbi:MAG TPA: Bax inhibitor-1/YccA family protein [Gammaproteobacteria bacterium]|nr:Bax inhibitor-1/YccA family protein [Gammaproteobacteria bacterium]